MFQHLGKARQKMLPGKRPEKRDCHQNRFGRRKRPDFIFQTVEIYSGFSTHGRIDRPQQRGGNIDITDTSLERSGGKPSEIGYHTAAEVHHHRMAGCTTIAQLLPHRCQ